ncbi:MAG: 50S ribosomal protein L21 [Chloroflexi bacterium]|nr:50S ribosomal protein L21 [Chloroflexota bacterium]
MYAIVETGGHQYKVSPGMQLDVERLDAEPGALVELDRVLLVAHEGEPAVGRPTVPGARVRARVIGEVKGDKIVVFRYKAKSRYRRKTGHRQRYTRLAIEEIVEEIVAG